MKPRFLMTLLRRHPTATFKRVAPSLSAGHLAAVALMVIAALLLPRGAQAAVSAASAIITDPVKPTQQARVDSRGNLQVTTNLQPVQRGSSVVETDPTAGRTFADLYQVPAGKRLVIQYVQGRVQYHKPGNKPALNIHTIAGGFPVTWIVETSNEVSVTVDNADFDDSKQVTIYADAGTTVQMSMDGGAPGNIGLVHISGVLVDV